MVWVGLYIVIFTHLVLVFSLFLFVSFLFSRLIVKATYSNSLYYNGIVFVLVGTLFTINRSSVSGLIFIIIFYSVLYLFFVKSRVK